MKIQGRLTLGIGVLFAMILLLGIQSVSYVRQLSRATGTILADNYNSLQYAGDMLRSLNDIGQDSVSRHALRQSLALQQQNITEVSEKELTAAFAAACRQPERPRHRGRDTDRACRPLPHYGGEHGGHPGQELAGRGACRLCHVVADRRGRPVRPGSGRRAGGSRGWCCARSTS